MAFRDDVLAVERPSSVRSVSLPRRQKFHPSPADWRDEVLYFLLPDRFSDGDESTRPLLDPKRAADPEHRPRAFKWNAWSRSGGDRWQGGTLRGLATKLDYIKGLGATTIWIGPVFRQRGHLDTFHGYAIQDFLDVDPRLGTRKDLVELVDAAHRKEMRVILDTIFNHSGCNWLYADGARRPPYRPFPGFYDRGSWVDAAGQPIAQIAGNDDGVWPEELQQDDDYTRAGTGNLGAGDLEDEHAEHKRTDFEDLRDFNLDRSRTLGDLALCYKYWIALTDCDGFRLDTLKHVSAESGRNFCGSLKEFASNLGKADFFLVGEVAGSDGDAERYSRLLGLNLNATLDIGEGRVALREVARGRRGPGDYFDKVLSWDAELGSHRNSGRRHVSILDDHDHVSGDKTRFSADADSDHQVVAGVAIQLFSLGIPCIYYGTEQALSGPEVGERKWLEDFGNSDRYLREAMFGPTHPRASGRAGLDANLDETLPGFGAFGTVGHHCFNTRSPAYVRIAALAALRDRFPVLRYGRQYLRPISNFGAPFGPSPAGDIIAWSRILDDEEALCVVNGNGKATRGGDVVVDAALNGDGASFVVIGSSAETGGAAGGHRIGQKLPVKRRDGAAFVEIRDLPPSEVLVLIDRP